MTCIGRAVPVKGGICATCTSWTAGSEAVLVFGGGLPGEVETEEATRVVFPSGHVSVPVYPVHAPCTLQSFEEQEQGDDEQKQQNLTLNRMSKHPHAV